MLKIHYISCTARWKNWIISKNDWVMNLLWKILAKMKQKFIWVQFMDKKCSQDKAYNMKMVKLNSEILFFCSDSINKCDAHLAVYKLDPLLKALDPLFRVIHHFIRHLDKYNVIILIVSIFIILSFQSSCIFCYLASLIKLSLVCTV